MSPPFGHSTMNLLIDKIRHSPVLWLLAWVPVAIVAAETDARSRITLLFVLSVLAIVPLAVLLSHATESIAARTGCGE